MSLASPPATVAAPANSGLKMSQAEAEKEAPKEVMAFDPKYAITAATKGFLAAFACLQSGCSAQDALLEVTEAVVTGALWTIPTVGPLLSGIVGLLWPAGSKTSVWDQIKNQVDKVVGAAIRQVCIDMDGWMNA